MPRPGPRYLVIVFVIGLLIMGGLLTYFQVRNDSFPLLGIIMFVAALALGFFGYRFLQNDKEKNDGTYSSLNVSTTPNIRKLDFKLLAVTLICCLGGMGILMAVGSLQGFGIVGLVLFLIGFVCHFFNVIKAMTSSNDE